jgi:hypothetical protein
LSVQNRRYSKNLNAISNTLRTGKANILILGDSIHNIGSASTLLIQLALLKDMDLKRMLLDQVLVH